MEEFIFVAPDGEVYRKNIDGDKIRHGDIAYKFMELKNLPLIDIDPDTKNGFYWGKELANNHSIFAIQNSGKSGALYIPSNLTDNQKIWIEENLMSEIQIFSGLLLVCDFIEDNMKVYDSTKCDVICELEKSLSDKGVSINSKESGDLNDIGNKTRHN